MPASSRLAARARPAWRDLRFLLGILLIVASVSGVWAVVHAGRQTDPVLMAAAPLVPGQHITAADVVEVEVQLGTSADRYLVAADLDSGPVAARVVRQGEFVPVSAVVSPDDLDVTTVVVRSALDVPEGIVAGAGIELWAAPVVAPGEFGEPSIIVADAIVGKVLEDDGVVAQSGATLEVIVPRDQVADVLAHAAGGSAVSAVPASVARADPSPPPDPPQTAEPRSSHVDDPEMHGEDDG